MLNILRKAKLAILSRYNHTGELTESQKKRLIVCSTCPYNSDNKEKKSLKDKIFLFLNRQMNYLFGVGTTENSICTLCGCNLIFKSAQEERSDWCEIGKWDNIK